MRCEQTNHKRTAQKCSRAKVKHTPSMLAINRDRLIFLKFAISLQRYNWSLQEHSLPYQSTQWLKRKTPNVVPAWLMANG